VPTVRQMLRSRLPAAAGRTRGRQAAQSRGRETRPVPRPRAVDGLAATRPCRARGRGIARAAASEASRAETARRGPGCRERWTAGLRPGWRGDGGPGLAPVGIRALDAQWACARWSSPAGARPGGGRLEPVRVSPH